MRAACPGRSSSWRSEAEDVRTLHRLALKWGSLAFKMIMLNTNPGINMDTSWFICWRWHTYIYIYICDLFCLRWCMNISSSSSSSYIYIYINTLSNKMLLLWFYVLKETSCFINRVQPRESCWSSKAVEAFRSAKGQRFPEKEYVQMCSASLSHPTLTSDSLPSGNLT